MLTHTKIKVLRNSVVGDASGLGFLGYLCDCFRFSLLTAAQAQFFNDMQIISCIGINDVHFLGNTEDL